MFKRCFVFLAATVSILAADTLELKDNATISGRILSEKPDQVAIDVGYTVLVVPRTQIAKINVQKETPVVETKNQTPPASEKVKKLGFFRGGVADAKDRTVREMVAQLGEAVVQVRTPGGLGSGFFINEEGYLITNFHVIEGETQISVEVYHQKDGELDRKSYKQVRIIAMNKFVDMVLLKVDDKDAPLFSWVLLGDSDSLAVGERVFAIGSPLGLERTVTEGMISTKTRQMAGELYLQTTAQINPGNSGGPLFNMRGEVIGVTNMKITFGEGLGFAIPIESVKYFLNHRDAYAYDNDNPSNAFRYLDPPSRAQKPLQ
jgi:serine protease Do